jgi:hypothetical protein
VGYVTRTGVMRNLFRIFVEGRYKLTIPNIRVDGRMYQLVRSNAAVKALMLVLCFWKIQILLSIWKADILLKGFHCFLIGACGKVLEYAATSFKHVSNSLCRAIVQFDLLQPTLSKASLNNS